MLSRSLLLLQPLCFIFCIPPVNARPLNRPTSPCDIVAISDAAAYDGHSVQVSAIPQNCEKGSLQWMYPIGQLHLGIRLNLDSLVNNRHRFLKLCLIPHTGYNGAEILFSNNNLLSEEDIKKKSAQKNRALCEVFSLENKLEGLQHRRLTSKSLYMIYTFRLRKPICGSQQRCVEISDDLDSSMVSFDYSLQFLSHLGGYTGSHLVL